MSISFPTDSWLPDLGGLTPEGTQPADSAAAGEALSGELDALKGSGFQLFGVFDRSDNLRPLAQRLAQDGVISAADVKEIVKEAKDFGKITAEERAALVSVLREHADRFAPDALVGLWRFLGGSNAPAAASFPATSDFYANAGRTDVPAIDQPDAGQPFTGPYAMPPQEGPGASWQTYTVAAGDSYGSLAARFGVPLSDLLRWNADSLGEGGLKMGAQLKVLDPRSGWQGGFFDPTRMPTLHPGSPNGGGVRMLQGCLNAWLKRHGKPQLPLDGSFGAKTKEALVAYQRSNELPQTGVADAATWRCLVDTATIETIQPSRRPPLGQPSFDPQAMPELRYGSPHGQEVIKLKELMNAFRRTRNMSTLPTTGQWATSFGPQTQKMVKEFQYLNGLRQTGVVDRKTWEKLAAIEVRDTRSDLRPVSLEVPWISQLDRDGRVERPSTTACYRGSRAMVNEYLANEGIKATPLWGMIIVGDTETASGDVITTREKADAARNYIDRSLDAGLPVHVGVSYVSGNRYNVNPVTDHYVVITGRGREPDGRLYYTFNDPWPGRDDPSAPRRFYVDADGKLEKPVQEGRGNTYRRAEVSEVLTWREIP